MKKILYIIGFFSNLFLFSQENILAYKVEWNSYEIDNNTGLLIPNSEEKDTFYNIFLLSQDKDTLFFYNQEDDFLKGNLKEIFQKRLTINIFRKKVVISVLEGKNKDSFSLIFNDSTKNIKIDEDIYYLEKKYYDFLKEKVLKDRDITEILELFSNKLGEYYFLEDFFPIRSKSRDKMDLKILKVYTKTTSPIREASDQWEAVFTYDSKGLLEIQKKKINNPNRIGFYNKKRIFIDKKSVCFKIVDDTEIYSKKIQQETFLDEGKTKSTIEAVNYRKNVTILMKHCISSFPIQAVK